MKRRVLMYLASVLLILLCMACESQSVDRDALSTEVAATIYAERGVRVPATTGTPPPAAPGSVEIESPTYTPTVKTAAAAAPASRDTATSSPTPEGPPLAVNQVLNLSLPGLDSIDPAATDPDQVAQIVTEVFVGLTRQNEETAEVEHGIALSWEMSDNGRVWTFFLRSDVPWVRYNSGSREVELVTDNFGRARYVTAHDFEYGIKYALDPDTDAPNAFVLYLIEGAEEFHDDGGSANSVGVHALDDATLEIRLAEAAGYFDAVVGASLAAAIPQWQIDVQGSRWTESRNLHTYGPYAVKDWVADSHLTLVDNPHWPGTDSIPRPVIDEIHWTVMDDETALRAYLARELDAVDVPPDVIADLRGELGFTVQPRACTFFLGLNAQKPPFDDPQVRLAFSLALDRRVLVDEVLEGGGEPAHWFSRPGLRAGPGIAEYPELGVGYDPEQARELLKQAYPDPLQMPPIAMAYWDSGPRADMARTIQEMWMGVLGVVVELEPMDIGDYFDALGTDAPQIWPLTWCADNYGDAHDALGKTFSEDGRLTIRAMINWSDGQFERLLRQAATSTDTAQRIQWYAQAEDILVRREAALIPIYWFTRNTLTQPYIRRTYSHLDGMERLEKWAVLDGAPVVQATRRPIGTPRPTRTRPPTPTPGPTHTPTPTPCLPNTSFAADVTVPDGTGFSPGEPFIKTWRMHSNGCAPWPPGSTWAFVSGDRMGAPSSVPVPDTPLGGTADISVEMVVPDAPGTYQGTWQMQDGSGKPFGDEVVVIIVSELPPPRRLATGTVIKQAAAMNGKSRLTVENGLDLDGVAVLTWTDERTMFAVYVQNHDEFTITGIPDGTYKLFFTLGEDWDQETVAFTRKKRLARFEDLFSFTSTATRYTVGTVTLHPVTGGTAGTDSVSEGDFPDLD